MEYGDVSLEEIKRALEHDEFVFHYQARISFVTGGITGAEALLRWRRDGELRGPETFLPIAERSGYISALSSGMFPRLLSDLAHMRRDVGRLMLAFNISAQDLIGDGLVRQVRQALEDGMFERDDLELEIAEASVVSHEFGIAGNVRQLARAGIRLSMDDYGIGSSSSETLERLPFASLKVDQGFVRRMVGTPRGTTMIKATIAMAQMLGMGAVVEGIESEEAYAALLHSGGEEAQGYWMSRPLPLEDFIDLARTRRRWPSSPVGLLRMHQIRHSWWHKLLADAAHAYLHGRTPADETLDALRPGLSQCALGRWYNGPGQLYAGYREFDRLERPHRLMHILYAALADALKHAADRDTVATLIDELGRESVEMCSALQHLETRALLGELH